MNRTPWQLWDLGTGNAAEGADTLEAREGLDVRSPSSTARGDHPGLLHLYIHLMEMSPHPELALRHGDRLNMLVPDAGHLLHMGTHIDVLCGDYYNVVARNSQAIEADRKRLEREGADKFLHRLPVPQLSLPEDAELYAMTTALMRYARTVAMANTGDVAGAETETDAFAARERVPEGRMLFNNTCRDILKVAEAMMLGELEYKKGNIEAGLAHLRGAVACDVQSPDGNVAHHSLDCSILELADDIAHGIHDAEDIVARGLATASEVQEEMTEAFTRVRTH